MHMLYSNSIKLFLCLCTGAITDVCMAKKSEFHSERIKKMNNPKESQHTVSEWLSVVRTATATKKSGQCAATDATGRPVILEWNITDILSPDLAVFKKNVSDLAAQTHAVSEVQFLHVHPEAASQDGFLKACVPLFANGLESVDWQQVEATIQSTYKQFYLMDIASFGADIIKRIADDLYFFVTIKEAPSGENSGSDKILGFMMTAVTPALAYGDIKLIKLALAPTELDRGLGELLVGSIFKVIPQAKRIFSIIRPTDKNALKAYLSWGFVQDENPVQDPNHPMNLNYLTILEYKTDQSDRLQKTAKTLVG